MAEKVIFSSRKKEPKASSVVNQEAQKKVRKKKSSFATKGTRGIRREIYRLLKDGGEKRGIFVPRPRDFAFENQMPKEKIILLLRRHWITNLSWLFVVVLMSGVPLLLKNFPPFVFFPFPFRLVGVMIWYLFVFAVFLEHFFSWYFSVNIITDERIVDIDFISLIHKRISEAKKDKKYSGCNLQNGRSFGDSLQFWHRLYSNSGGETRV